MKFPKTFHTTAIKQSITASFIGLCRQMSVVLERLLLALKKLLCHQRVKFSDPTKKIGREIVVQEAPEFVEAATKECLLNKQ